MSEIQDGPPASRLPLSRRELLRATAAGVPFLGMAAHVLGADESKLIVRNSSPLDAETPASGYREFLTPNEVFFVRSHFGPPAVGLRPWTLEVSGGVRAPRTFDLEALAKLAGATPATTTALLQCTGNGRGFFRPTVPGVPWERGAVGNAVWGGVPLARVLEACGVLDGFGHVHLQGADGPPNPKTPAFLRSIPMDRAVDPSTFVATSMNGVPLPWLHGGPIRLVVPGWTGNHWMKWLRKIVVAREPAPGFFQQNGYKLPKVPAPPGAEIKPEDLESVSWLNVKSMFAAPFPGMPVAPGRVYVHGWAWTGRGVVTDVQVEIDGEWKAARFDPNTRPQASRGTWRAWSMYWDATPGRHVLKVRATDSEGVTQPEEMDWNRSGYLWNRIERMEIEVRPNA